MFDFRELKLMFLDPTDLIINNINKFLYTNKESLEDKKIRTKKEYLQKEKIGKLFPKKK